MNIAVRASMRRESVYMLWCWMDNSWMKSGGWESFRNTNAIHRIRNRLPLSVQGVTSFRTTCPAHLSPRLSSRNRSTVEGE
jgi:uncharacterized protein (UPF0276 family)